MSNAQDCDQEPIHLAGMIQAHGVLLVLNKAFQVIQCSANIEARLGRSVSDSLESSLDSIVGVQPASLIREALERDLPPANPLFLGTFSINNASFDLLVHEHAGLTIAELEETEQTPGAPASGVFRMLSQSIGTLQQQISLPELCQTAAREMRSLTGFDRVLIYRFGPDWAGTVVAESRTDQLPSYLDLRFPESDIPRQARELYRLNHVRHIADANSAPVPLIPAMNRLTGTPTDLTYSALRSVSPIHIEYMKNMGTSASMSVSIVRDGQLWGLVSCHHHAPSRVSVEVRLACGLLAQTLSSQIAAASERASNRLLSQLQAAQQLFLTRLSEADSIVEAVKANQDAMLRCVDSDGAAVLFDGQCERIGMAPTESQVRELAAWISTHNDRNLFATDELPRRFSPGEPYRATVSGVLAASISEFGIGYLLWFRSEKSTQVSWAGNPNEIKVAVDGRFHPRKSFQIWTQHESGRSVPWESAEVDSVRFLRSAIVNLVLQKARD